MGGIVISDKERSKIWHRKKHLKAVKENREVFQRTHYPIIFTISKIIKAFKPKRNHKRSSFSKRRNQKYRVIKED